MKYFVQYYDYRVGSDLGELVEACGSDSVANLDGRWSFIKMAEMAEKMNESCFKHFPAFQLMRSHNGLYSQSSPIGSLQRTKWVK